MVHHSLWYTVSKMWLGSGVAVAVVYAGSCSLDLPPSLEISMCHGSQKKKKKEERGDSDKKDDLGVNWMCNAEIKHSSEKDHHSCESLSSIRHCDGGLTIYAAEVSQRCQEVGATVNPTLQIRKLQRHSVTYSRSLAH